MTMLDESDPTQTGFLTFDRARGAAEDHAVTRGHRMRWMIWGEPPRSGRGLCERCGRDLWVERTRSETFRLHGSALPPCAPPSLALSYTLDTARPTVIRPISALGVGVRASQLARPP